MYWFADFSRTGGYWSEEWTGSTIDKYRWESGTAFLKPEDCENFVERSIVHILHQRFDLSGRNP